MRQLQLRGDVANGVDAGDVGAHTLVNLNGTTVGELHTSLFQAVALHARGKADGDHHTVNLEGFRLRAVLGFHIHLNEGAVVTNRGCLVSSEKFHTKIFVLLGDFLGDVSVLVGENAVHKLYDGHVHTVVGQHVSELHTDRTGTHNDH